MPITRKLVAQDTNEDNQWLKVDSAIRYIVNDTNDWQFLFGPNSAFSSSNQIIKISAEFNKETFDTIRFASYLYNQGTGAIDNAASITFNVYLVTTPNWTEQFIYSFAGSQIGNNYFYADVPLSSLTPVDFFGGDTIMVEAVGTRLSQVYRDRVYINHLGIFDNAFRLKQKINYLDLTKLDE